MARHTSSTDYVVICNFISNKLCSEINLLKDNPRIPYKIMVSQDNQAFLVVNSWMFESVKTI